MSLEDVIIHIRIEEQNRNRDNVEKPKELSSKANVVEEKPKPKNNRSKKQNSRTKPNASNKVKTQLLKNGVIALLWQVGHHAAQCRHRKRTEKSNSKANLAEAEVITTVISSEIYSSDWQRESSLKLTFGKVLALSDVLHVPDIAGTWCQYLAWKAGGAPLNLWGKAILSACHIQNRIPYKKTGPKTFDAMFIGYAENSATYRKEKKLCKLVKSLYGLKQAPKQWHNKFDHVLVTNGYSINDADKCIYNKYEDSTCVVICLYVDDMLIFGTSLEVMCETKKFLGSKFDMKGLGEAELKKNREHSVAQIEYAQIIGNLMYLINYTRPDIAYVVERLRFIDANWISDSNEMKSTSGYVSILSGSAVSWKSAKKTCITRFTMEVEFIALEKTSSKVEWLRNLLVDIPLWM
ncbi:Retrovirus-related Pol polyprotein from transposon TNT 1-94 [Vitis vinifera]|uniref:Retrovirus-related Pol polyprotein from transposon TNT 1-94 n=1 Tax=Vitis vinifera TaxID=29760 RepID=A0A438FEZ2_VITVI|nr:Retrovirus-related Pol polyprotein from transposon TNT 1-94 [Vitis vinifera]